MLSANKKLNMIHKKNKCSLQRTNGLMLEKMFNMEENGLILEQMFNMEEKWLNIRINI